MSRPAFEDHRRHVHAIIRAVLDACEPAACVRRWLRERPTRLARPAVLAIGKAAAGMERGWSEVAGEAERRLMVVPAGAKAPGWALRGEHLLPGEGSLRAGLAVREFVAGARGRCDGLVVLLSGGASSLAVQPVEGLDLEAYRAAVEGLLKAGATIHELNTVRKHLDLLKGGRLALLAGELPVEAYVLSDVIGDDPSVIASGPLTADATTVEEAMGVLEGRGVAGPAARVLAETPKDAAAFRDVRFGIVASNQTALKAAEDAALKLGFGSVAVTPGTCGEAAEAGRRMARGLIAARAGMALLWGGETTVTVGAEQGPGGRNQEVALAAAVELAGRAGVALAALGTDGVDGPTDAAGAIVTGETAPNARAAGLDCAEALRRHDSNGFFVALERSGRGCLIKTGPTGTNVNDVAIGLLY